MKLLLTNRNLIIGIGENINFGFYGDTDKWNIDDSYYFIDGNYHIEEVEEVPLNVIPDKYYYIDGEFVLNENFINESEEITALKTQITDLELALVELYESLGV